MYGCMVSYKCVKGRAEEERRWSCCKKKVKCDCVALFDELQARKQQEERERVYVQIRVRIT